MDCRVKPHNDVEQMSAKRALVLLESGLLVLMCQLYSSGSFRGAGAKRRRARNPYSPICGYGFRALGLRPSPGMTGRVFPEHGSPVRGKASLDQNRC